MFIEKESCESVIPFAFKRCLLWIDGKQWIFAVWICC